MLDAELRAQLDQACAALSEVQPVLWWGLYAGMISQGFTNEQALELLKTFINTAYHRVLSS